MPTLDSTRLRTHLLLTAAPIILALAASQPTTAQDAPPNDASSQEGTQEQGSLEVIRVQGRAWPNISASFHDARTDDGKYSPAADAAAFLRELAGIDAGRGGGHGLEPVIRGQSQNQLNVTSDGAFQFGGCPNRMDPPTATTSLEKADRVEVMRGFQSVTFGPGGSGGTIRLIREAPTFEEGQHWTAKGHASYESNGDIFGTFARTAARIGDHGWARLSGSYKDAGNYEDGDGKEVRSSYDSWGYSGEIGYKNEWTDVAVSFDQDRVDDALFPGAAMDSILDDSETWRFKARHEFQASRLQDITLSLYDSSVEHVMDDFSLRTAGAMVRRAPSTSDTSGGKIETTLAVGSIETKIGIDHQSNDRTAILHMGMVPMIDMPSTERFFLWPGVEIAQTGFYAESIVALTRSVELTGGLRYDRVEASADLANQIPVTAMRTPNQGYQLYYGTDFSQDRTEDNVSGLIRFDYDLSPSTRLYAGLSRSVRTADATERAMARDMAGSMMAANGWIGNPGINPEQHHQFDIGLSHKRKDWTINVAAYVDQVDDYILRDRARGQSGVLLADGATVYRNIDARLTGVEFLGIRRWGPWQVSMDATFTYGDNDTDDIPLAQIPPLNGSLVTTYDGGDWDLGAKMRFATKQTRVDDDPTTGSGRDVRETPGWAVLDLFGTWAFYEEVSLEVGLNNVLDKTYAHHLNRENVFDATSVQVNEPGRSFYIRLRAAY